MPAHAHSLQTPTKLVVHNSMPAHLRLANVCAGACIPRGHARAGERRRSSTSARAAPGTSRDGSGGGSSTDPSPPSRRKALLYFGEASVDACAAVACELRARPAAPGDEALSIPGGVLASLAPQATPARERAAAQVCGVGVCGWGSVCTCECVWPCRGPWWLLIKGGAYYKPALGLTPTGPYRPSYLCWRDPYVGRPGVWSVGRSGGAVGGRGRRIHARAGAGTAPGGDEQWFRLGTPPKRLQ